MRASLQNKPGRFTLKLHLDIQFSEEEKAIITNRSLQNSAFDISPGRVALPTTQALLSLLPATVASFLLGFAILLIAGFAKSEFFMAIGTLLIFGSPVLAVVMLISAVANRNLNETTLTLGYLIDHSHIVITTDDPVQLPTAEHKILLRLSDLKTFLTQTHDLVLKRTIEL